MSIDRRAEALLALVLADRDARCEAVLGAAHAEAGALLAQAHARARQRVRAALEEERRVGQARLEAAQARRETRRRLAEQQHARALLQAAWLQLPHALQARWEDPRARAQWIGKTLDSARRVLPHEPWQIRHPSGWHADEQTTVEAELAGAGIAVTFTPDSALHAGLTINAGGNTIDASLDGLLAGRDEIGGRLLALLEAAP